MRSTPDRTSRARDGQRVSARRGRHEETRKLLAYGSLDPLESFRPPRSRVRGPCILPPLPRGSHDAHRLPRAPTRCAIERYYSLTFRPSKEGGDVIFREEGLERETYQYPETASVPCLYVARRRIEPEPFGPPFRRENEAPQSRRARGLPRGVPLSLCRRRG